MNTFKTYSEAWPILEKMEKACAHLALVLGVEGTGRRADPDIYLG